MLAERRGKLCRVVGADDNDSHWILFRLPSQTLTPTHPHLYIEYSLVGSVGDIHSSMGMKVYV